MDRFEFGLGRVWMLVRGRVGPGIVGCGLGSSGSGRDRSKLVGLYLNWSGFVSGAVSVDV